MHIRSIASAAAAFAIFAVVLGTLCLPSHAQQPASAAASVPAAAQAKLDKLEAALTTARTARDDKATATALNAIGDVYFDLSDFAKALDFYTQALSTAHAANDPQQLAAALNGLANCYREQSQKDKALANYQQALDVATASGDPDGQATALNGLGWVNFNAGQLGISLDFHNRALPLAQKAEDSELEASILRRIGNVYYARGDRQQALDYQKLALPVCVKAGDRRGEGRTLGNIGVIYSDLGEKQQALEYSNRALPILREVGDRTAEATALNNIGLAYSDLGNQVEAVKYYAQSLPLRRQIGDRSGEATELINIGLAFAIAGNSKQAEDYDTQAIAIVHALGERRAEAIALGNLAVVESQLGEQQKAIERLTQSLVLIRQVGDRSGEALTLTNLGAAYDRAGDPQKALDCYRQALPIAAAVKDPIREALVFYWLMQNQKAEQPVLAVFYGKQSVNLLQQVRGNMQGLDRNLQKSFLDSKGEFYHDLADLLIAQGRLPEAQRVLDLLKQQEYQDYVRGETANALNPLALTPDEQQAEQDYAKSTTQIVGLAQQWDELNKNTARTPEQDKQFKQLSGQIDAAGKGLDLYYGRLYTLFGKGSEANKQMEDVKTGVSALGQEIADMPHTVALYTLVGKDRTSIIVITGSTEVARQVAIGEVELNRKVAVLEQALRDRSKDPRPAAQELYKILIEPVKADLDQAHAETLVWSLDGVLRYVPMAALFDGKQYLVERYNTVTITPASIPHLAEKPDVSTLSVAAMGISHKYEEGLSALPAVVGELNEIVKSTGTTGVLPGTILLDSQFTEKTMEDQLRGQHPIVHIASHFVFKPGDDSQSYLLLAGKEESGAGFHLTVADFNSDRNLNLRRTDLLTLSACETGMSGSASNGREVDGLGTTAQLKGAKAVISSLWEVDDVSTGELMGDFYKRWADGHGKVEKVEALRQAQLDLLLGRVKAKVGTADRGFIEEGDKKADKVDKPGPAVSLGLAHPFYWAPFVLMGNWR